MTWKKDLNKLKQALDKEETPPAKAAPPPKARPVEAVPRSIEEEDQMFLAAMGLRAKPQARPAKAAPEAAPAPPPLAPPPPPPSAAGEFSSAMGDLKGLKPMRPAPVRAAAPAPAAPAAKTQSVPRLPDGDAEKAATAPPVQTLAPEPVPDPPAPEEEPASPAGPPQARIHLAAGMAVVVDGSLDLKGHGRNDAEERLKERLLDGYALGWRTLHVRVGSSPELSQMVLDLLASPAGHCVARYAQAPVPMGGAQAWILYFRSQSSSEN